MTVKEWFKNIGTHDKAMFKGIWEVNKFMYKDKVDLIMHLMIVAVFIWGFFSGKTDMMAAVGFFGVYAYGAAYRQAYWKKLYKEDYLDKVPK